MYHIKKLEENFLEPDIFILTCLFAVTYHLQIILNLLADKCFRYNGFLPPGDRGRRRSKFVLYKRSQPNGVKKSKHYVVKTPHSSQVNQCAAFLIFKTKRNQM